MSARPHDALFKAAFAAPASGAWLLRALLPPAVCAAIDWATLDRDDASFADVRFSDRHSDLLFFAQLHTREPGFVYFLLEHQSTAEPAMPQRMLAYQARIWDRFRREQPRAPLPPIITALVSHAPGGWTAPASFEEFFDPEVLEIPGMAALVPRPAMLALDLAHQSNADLQARQLPAFQTLALWLLRDARTSQRLLDNFDAWRYFFREAGLTRSGIDDLSVLIEYMFRVVDPTYHAALHAKIAALDPRAEELSMTIAEHLHEQGRTKGFEQGRTKGLEQGYRQARLDMLRDLLVLKFQALDPVIEARLQAAAPEAIDRYLQRLLGSASLSASLDEVLAD